MLVPFSSKEIALSRFSVSRVSVFGTGGFVSSSNIMKMLSSGIQDDCKVTDC
jgi:hypothetical protein